MTAIIQTLRQKFCIQALNAHQIEAIVQFVEQKTVVLVNLPTGFGKCLTCQSLSFVFDALYGEGHTVVGVGANINKSWNFCYTIVYYSITCARFM